MYNFWLKKQIYNTLLATAMLFFLSCTPRTLTEEGLKSYVLDPKNGLYKEFEDGATKVTLAYRPTGLLVAQELRGKDTVSNEEIERVRENYEAYAYFILSLSYNGQEYINKGLSDPNLYGQMIEQLAFDMRNQVEVVTLARDTVPVADAIFSRMYGMTGSNNVMLVFNAEKIKQSPSFRFRFKGNGLGIIDKSFEFKRKDIEKVPGLKVVDSR